MPSISYADPAIAIADEIDSPTLVRQRFTVAYWRPRVPRRRAAAAGPATGQLRAAGTRLSASTAASCGAAPQVSQTSRCPSSDGVARATPLRK
jgi:hypothetical protein